MNSAIPVGRIVFPILALVLILGNLTTTSAVGTNSVAQASPDPYANETPAQRDARMAWWREARFGLFIHWGVYSVPAGTYDGKQIPGIGEWIMNHGKIPMAEYQAFAKEFNPVKFNADDVGQDRQRRRHEIHRHHRQASRRLCDVRHQGQPVEHRAGDAVRRATP